MSKNFRKVAVASAVIDHLRNSGFAEASDLPWQIRKKITTIIKDQVTKGKLLVYDDKHGKDPTWGDIKVSCMIPLSDDKELFAILRPTRYPAEHNQAAWIIVTVISWEEAEAYNPTEYADIIQDVYSPKSAWTYNFKEVFGNLSPEDYKEATGEATTNQELKPPEIPITTIWKARELLQSSKIGDISLDTKGKKLSGELTVNSVVVDLSADTDEEFLQKIRTALDNISAPIEEARRLITEGEGND